MGLFDVDTKELFAFNLLPPRSKVEIEQEQKSKEKLIYSLLAPAVIVLTIVVMLGINFLVVTPTQNRWEDAVGSYRDLLSTPSSDLGQLRVTNGELKIKTDFIAEPVERNVDFDTVFDTVQSVFSANQTNSNPTSYGRRLDGLFLVNATSTNADGPAEILERLKNNQSIRSAEITQVTRPGGADNNYNFTIVFELSSIELANTINDV